MSAFAIRTITHCVIAETVDRRSGCPAKHPSPKKIVGSENCDHGFLPLLGDDGRFDLAALNVENRIRGFTLPVDNLILPIIGNGSPPVHFSQKYFGIEWGLAIADHGSSSFHPTFLRVASIPSVKVAI
jgi:hypothetical protein